MGYIFIAIVVLALIGGIINEVNKNKANAYLAKKYDEEKKKGK
ncbi:MULTISPECIES: hypothetical protein [Clostridium]|nr:MULTISPECIES: hypothetical protein [Clostridium]